MEFIQKFKKSWPGGYFEGNPLDPMSSSGYGIYGYNSLLYTVYLTCIRNFVTSETTVLEIGPGRGAWSKTFLSAGCKLLYAVDAAPAEHTGFWQYVGRDGRASYIEAKDFTLSTIPDDSIDYFFSFGVFCHLKPEMCEAYIAALASKMRSGAHGFLMIADYDKYNSCLENVNKLSVERFMKSRKLWIFAWFGYQLSRFLFRRKTDFTPLSKSDDINQERDLAYTGWYHWGLDRACNAMEQAGFRIIQQDVGAVARDPVIHFIK